MLSSLSSFLVARYIWQYSSVVHSLCFCVMADCNVKPEKQDCGNCTMIWVYGCGLGNGSISTTAVCQCLTFMAVKWKCRSSVATGKANMKGFWQVSGALLALWSFQTYRFLLSHPSVAWTAFTLLISSTDVWFPGAFHYQMHTSIPRPIVGWQVFIVCFSVSVTCSKFDIVPAEW